MNPDLCAAVSPLDPGDDGLLTMVDFKWLMAGLGWRVDLTRMRRDAAYLVECAQRGLASGSTLLRERSVDLLFLQSALPS
ncbi:MAG TPA: hypothetical protein VLK85_11500 [Ramlibacter sp.]|nr:hypothetical protein [Ramlibacter sp.]